MPALDPQRTQNFKRFYIYGNFRQPHALRITMETVLEIPYSPEDLRVFITRVRQGKDDVVVGLGQR